ncbi:DICT sensory domain-containing protein [Haloarchaeobius sp. DYHT-AS-18]|uniref:DICT sensory domain-containing protein n=1 Tax=Haloarchaeobius sp. DYHT-AS-18 TaxID=3446117 RepID=UPI003EBCFB01
MSLSQILETMRSRRKTMTVYASEPIADLDLAFEARNVSLRYEPLPEGDQEGFIVVSDDGGYIGSVGLGAVAELVSPESSRGLSTQHRNSAFQCLLELLDDTVFRSLSKRQLLATSREIEDRAWRVGRGELHTGFQNLSAMKEQAPVYEKLGRRGDLSVHVYGLPDWMPDSMTDVWFYPVQSTEIGRYWFVVYDGGGDDLNACALLAEETAPGEFEGFWTYDPTVVADIKLHVSQRYGPAKSP